MQHDDRSVEWAKSSCKSWDIHARAIKFLTGQHQSALLLLSCSHKVHKMFQNFGARYVYMIFVHNILSCVKAYGHVGTRLAPTPFTSGKRGGKRETLSHQRRVSRYFSSVDCREVEPTLCGPTCTIALNPNDGCWTLTFGAVSIDGAFRSCGCVATASAEHGECKSADKRENKNRLHLFVLFYPFSLWLVFPMIGGCSYQNSAAKHATAVQRWAYTDEFEAGHLCG